MDDVSLQRIYNEIANPAPPRKALHRDRPTDSAKRKFLKVYRGPGYPSDPRNARARARDAYVNAFAPQPPGVLDRRPLDTWLAEGVN